MKQNLPIIIFVTFLALALNACAQSKTTTDIKRGSSYATLVESVTQKLPENARDGYTDIQQRFVIIWKNKQAPETFYWRGADGWLDCAVAKIHKKRNNVLPNYKKGENHYSY